MSLLRYFALIFLFSNLAEAQYSDISVCFFSSIESVSDSLKEDQVLNQFSNEELRSRLITKFPLNEVFLDDVVKLEIQSLIKETERGGVLSSKKLDLRLVELLSSVLTDKLVIIFSMGNQRKIQYARGSPKPTTFLPIGYFSMPGSLLVFSLNFYSEYSSNFVPEVVPAFNQLYYLRLNLKSGKVEKLFSQSFNRSPLNEKTLDEGFSRINQKFSK